MGSLLAEIHKTKVGKALDFDNREDQNFIRNDEIYRALIDFTAARLETEKPVYPNLSAYKDYIMHVLNFDSVKDFNIYLREEFEKLLQEENLIGDAQHQPSSSS